MTLIILVITLNTAIAYALWWLWFVGYRDYLVDRTLQDLLRIRDGLFDRARAGEIGFDAEAYRITRATLNGMIRYAHELSAGRLLLVLPARRSAVKNGYAHEFATHLEQAKASLTQTQKVLIENAFSEMHKVVLRRMRDGSLVLRAGAYVAHIAGWILRHTLGRGIPLAVRFRKWLVALSIRMDVDAYLLAAPISSR